MTTFPTRLSGFSCLLLAGVLLLQILQVCLLVPCSLLLAYCWGLRRELSHTVCIAVAFTNHATIAKSGGLGSIAECRAVRTLSPEYGCFVVLPVVLLPFEATILGPEEEPDGTQDKGRSDEGKEGLDSFHIECVGGYGAGCGID